MERCHPPVVTVAGSFLRGGSYDRNSATGRFYERFAIGYDSAECHCGGRAEAERLVGEWRAALRPAEDTIAAGPYAADFVLRDRSRVRARLDSDCDGLDFYGSFYVEPRGAKVCAKRDEIRSRVGGSCRIERFRTLVPTLKRRTLASEQRK